MVKSLVIILSCVILMPACVQQSKSIRGLAHLEIGMSKRQVKNVMRSEGKTRGSIVLQDGALQEVIEFELSKDIDEGQHVCHAFLTLCTMGIWAPVWVADAVIGHKEVYWMTFINGRLTQFGHPNDWKTAPTHIQEFRVR